jgi:hypothetical protein
MTTLVERQFARLSEIEDALAEVPFAAISPKLIG